MKSLLKNNWLSFAVILGVLGWALTRAPGLPARLPEHFDIHGNPDRFDGKYFVLFFLPIVNFLVVIFLALAGRISPKGYDMPHGENIIGRFNMAITVFVMALYVGGILEGAAPHSGAFARLLLPSMAVFMIFIGNYFGKLERNFFIGIRLPWTLASQENWKRTHRFSGKVFVSGGLLALALSFIRPPLWSALAVILLAAVISVTYSFVYFLKFEKSS